MKKFAKIILGTIITLVLILLAIAIGNKITYDSMLEYIDSFGKVEYENQLVPEYDEYGVPYYVTDGDFKVMQLTDVHIGGGILSAEKDKKAINAVAAMITAEKPDMVVVTGDISFAVPWAGTINNKYAHEYFKRLMENLGVYWTVAFGNHDSEIYDYYNRAAVAEMYAKKRFTQKPWKAELLGMAPHWPETLVSCSAASSQEIVSPGPILPRTIQSNMLAFTN